MPLCNLCGHRLHRCTLDRKGIGGYTPAPNLPRIEVPVPVSLPPLLGYQTPLPPEPAAELSRLAALQAWLVAAGGEQGRAALLGWPALAVLRGQRLPDAPQVVELAVPVPAAVARWQALVAVGAPAPPEAIECIEVPGGVDFAAAVEQQLRSQPVRALAVAIDAQGQAVDPLGGLADASEQRLRLCGEARSWWTGKFEFALELAAVAAWTGLRPAGDLVKQVRRDCVALLNIDRSHWHTQLGSVLVAPHAAIGLRFLHDAGLLPLLVPEFSAMAGFHLSCPVHHKDIFDHTLQVVEKCPPHLVVRWAALMHDTGKVLTRTVAKGKVHFFGHEAVGALLMEGVAARLQLPKEVGERVVYVIGHHARANAYLADWTDSAVRRLVRDMGAHLIDVLAFSRADYTTKRAGRIAEVQALAAELAQRIPEIIAEAERVPPLPKGLGTLILQETGLPAGPWLGRVQAWLEGECDQGRLEPQREPGYYLQAVREQKPDWLQIDPEKARMRLRDS